MARLTGVRLTESVEQTEAAAAKAWHQVFAALYLDAPDKATTPRDFVEALIFERASTISLIGAVAAARENARQIREHISGEMWEHLNRQYIRFACDAP